MPWSLILWLIQLLGPALLDLIIRFFKRTNALAPTAANALTVELTAIKHSNRPRREKRALAKRVLRREMAAEAKTLAEEAELEASEFESA